MFLKHYDNTSIECTDDQFYSLAISTQILSEELLDYGKLKKKEVISAIYENDDIYYSAKFLFQSKIPEYNNTVRYFSLARLIYQFYYPYTNRDDIDNAFYYLTSFN